MRKNQTKFSRQILNECVGVVKNGKKITPLADNEYMPFSGAELRDLVEQIRENIKRRFGYKLNKKI